MAEGKVKPKSYRSQKTYVESSLCSSCAKCVNVGNANNQNCKCNCDRRGITKLGSSNLETIPEGNPSTSDPSHITLREQESLLSISKNYVTALRPWSFSASLIPILLGTALGYKETNEVNILAFCFTSIAILSVHGAGNLVNTFYDFKKGIDSKKSDDRTLVDQKLSPPEVASFGAFLYGVGCISLLFLCLTSPARVEHIALLYFGGLSSSFLYTGGIGLKYVAFGDVVILLSFGPLTVMFTFIGQTGLLKLMPFWYAIPLALITEAILHSNNSRDADTDRAANAVTVAIMLGPTASYILYCLLLFIPYILLAILGVHFSKAFFLPFLTLTFAFKLEKEFRKGNLTKLPNKTAMLDMMFGLCYVTSFLISEKESLPGFDDSQ